jgi:uncharacterized protein (DUF2267 family)
VTASDGVGITGGVPEPQPPDMQRFATAVRSRAPDLDSDERVREAAEAVLSQLGRYVTGPAAQRLAPAMPEELRFPLDNASGQGNGGESDDFFAAVAAAERSDDLTTAAGHVQAVFRAIADTADPDAVRAVREQLTSELRVLLAL